MSENTPENVAQPQQPDYSPEEIAEAMNAENTLTQQVVLQQLQQRNIGLSIEVKRAQQRAAKVEDENRILRSIIRDFEDTRPVEKGDVEAVEPVVEKYLEQARAAEAADRAARGDDIPV